MDFLIHRLVWELKSSSEKQAVEAQKQVSLLSEDRTFLNSLEHALQKLVPPHQQVKIDQLEVDVAWHANGDLKTNVVQAIMAQVEQALQKSKSGPIIQHVEKTKLEQVISFLQRGRLPESAPAHIRTAEQFANYMLQDAAQRSALYNALARQLKNNPQHVDIATQWPLGVLAKLLSADAKVLEMATYVDRVLGNIQTPVLGVRQMRKAFLNALLKTEKTSWADARAQLEWLANQAPDQNTKQLLEVAQRLSPRSRKTKRAGLPTVAEVNPQPEDAPAQLFVRNAGLVLTAQFLPILFKALNLDATNPDHTPALLSVLAFIDLGNTDAPADLALYRLLLGLEPAESHMPASREISNEQREQVREMLTALIGHWRVLKNTSVDGLRATFFWRTGYISQTRDGWQLKVETQAQDVLLAHLPWSIGVIKLPWMPKPLMIDWI